MNQKKLEEFIKIHFEPNDNMYSFVIFGCKEKDNKIIWKDNKMKKKRKAIYQYGYAKTNDINKALEHVLNQSPYRDYYITANGFSSSKCRDSNHLFTLHNIVIDLDCHIDKLRKDGSYNTKFEALKYFLNELFNDYDFPTPNTMVETGRGIQLWWTIDPISYKAKEYYDVVRNYIIKKIKDVLEVATVSKCFNLDMSASKNYVGFFRIPGTYNSNTGRMGNFEIFHNDRIDVFEMSKKLGKENTTRDKHINRKSIYKNLAKYRENMLCQLIEVRNGEMTGFRDKSALILHSAYISEGYTIQEANEAVLSLNGLFSEPMSEKEILSYMSSSTNKGYKYTNSKIIEELDISVEEQDILNFHSAADGIRIRKKKRNAKKSRNYRIIAMFKKGYTQVHIARKVGCSQPTICRVIKKFLNCIKTIKNSIWNKTKNLINITTEKIKEIINEIKQEYSVFFEKISEKFGTDFVPLLC